MAVSAVVNSRKVAKHVAIEITDGNLAIQHRTEQIEAKARLDGIYVIRTSVPAEQLATNEAVQVVFQRQGRLTLLRVSKVDPVRMREISNRTDQVDGCQEGCNTESSIPHRSEREKSSDISEVARVVRESPIGGPNRLSPPTVRQAGRVGSRDTPASRPPCAGRDRTRSAPVSR